MKVHLAVLHLPADDNNDLLPVLQGFPIMPQLTSDVCPTSRQVSASRRKMGFTIVELLVVIGIIVVLISILVPAVGKVRRKAQDAATQAFMSQLSGAIDRYNTDFRAYPGPISNDEVYNGITPPPISIDSASSNPVPITEWETTPTTFNETITMSENLTLGLLGGLRFDISANKLFYDPRLVGSGPFTLKSGPVKRHEPYAEGKNLSWRTVGSKKTGSYVDDDGVPARDSFIPEFVDSYASPMPILYLRAKKGVPQLITGVTNEPKNNAIITYDPVHTAARSGQYDLHQIIGYTGEAIGSGRSVTPVTPTGRNFMNTTTSPHGLASVDPKAISEANPGDPSQKAQYHYPYDAYPYFRNQALSTPAQGTSVYATATERNDVAIQKDGYILISAGIDRVYGTDDDIKIGG